MAVQLAYQEGSLDIARAQERETDGIWFYTPGFYNQTLIANYKMFGKCSIHGWDSWVNATGNEAGRPIHGVQEPGTVVASWFIPEGV